MAAAGAAAARITARVNSPVKPYQTGPQPVVRIDTGRIDTGMMHSRMVERRVTTLLHAWRDGNSSALDEITGIVYPELRRLAAAVLRRERKGHTLEPTALVHEAWMRMAGADAAPSVNRAHFLAIAGHVMRQILIEHARRRQAIKRGGGLGRVTLSDAMAASGAAHDVLALDGAMEALEKLDERKAKLVEMRYFGGLTTEEMAEAMEVSTRTVERDLKMAHAWLYRELNPER